LSRSGGAASPRKRLTAQARREVIEQAATELFAERGYGAASMDKIASCSGVSVPVLYDHFPSKLELHRRLLERHFAELREIWTDKAPKDVCLEQRLPGALDAWFGYVQAHPFAWRMLFRDTSGDPQVQAVHTEVSAHSRAALLPLLASELGAETVAGALEHEAVDMVWEILRGVLQGLALWWHEHQHVPREQIVATAMNVLWIGFERAQHGESWQPTTRSSPAGSYDA
jgi:AcrR family transcriptional regulator